MSLCYLSSGISVCWRVFLEVGIVIALQGMGGPHDKRLRHKGGRVSKVLALTSKGSKL